MKEAAPLYLDVHSHKQGDFTLYNQYPATFEDLDLWYSLGIHPWYIQENTWEGELALIKANARAVNFLAVGECGLDTKIAIPLELQKRVFEAQLLLAQELGKPVIIHCVGAHQNVLEIQKKLHITVPLIFHGYTKSLELAKQIVQHGNYISFGKHLLSLPKLTTVLTQIPSSQIFLETDVADINIKELYTFASQKLQLDSSKIISDNFNRVFNPNSARFFDR